MAGSNVKHLLSSEASFFRDVAIKDMVMTRRAPITTSTATHFLSAMMLPEK